MRWALDNLVKGAKLECYAAHDTVVKQCPVCSGCLVERGMSGTRCANGVADFLYKKFEAEAPVASWRSGLLLLAGGVGFAAISVAAAALYVADRRRRMLTSRSIHYLPMGAYE